MPGASLKEKLDVAKTLEKFRQTRGRPQFTTQRGTGSATGLFSTFEHINPLAPPTPRSHSVAASNTAGDGTPRGRSRERSASAASAPKPLHEKPFRAPSASSGLFDPNCPSLAQPPAYFRSASGHSRDGGQSYSRTASAQHSQQRAANRSASAASRSNEPTSSAAAAPRSHQDSALAPLTLLLARNVSRKSRGDKDAEHESQVLRRSLDARYQLVTETAAAKSGSIVHRVPHDGLRVAYYDRGRKMTTAQLYAPRGSHENGDEENRRHESAAADELAARAQMSQRDGDAQSPTRDSLRYGPGMSGGLWSNIVAFCGESERKKLAGVNRSVGAIALTAGAALADSEPGPQQWKALRDADLRVRSIPSTFFEALRQLHGSLPPRRTLFALHMAAAIVDESLPLVADEATVWALLQPYIQKDVPEQLLSARLVGNPMGAVDRKRVAAVRYAIAEQEEALRRDGCAESLVAVVGAQSPHAASLLQYVISFLNVFNETMR